MLRAQQYPPSGVVGVPYSYDFGQLIDPYLANIPADIGFSFSFTPMDALPPGLMLASNAITGTPTQAGNYTFNVGFSETITYMGQTFSFGPYPLPIFIAITGNSGPAVDVNPAALTFSLTKGSTAVVTQSVIISNSASPAQNFTVNPSTSSGGEWLSVSPGSGTVAPFGTTSVSVNVDPSGLAVGTYLGTLSVSAQPSGQQFEIGVLASVSGGGAQLQISQSGLRFQTVAAGSSPPSQTISVLNGGAGSLNFTVSTSTTSGGAQWLTASPSSGAATSAKGALVSVSIHPTGLQPGDYYGQVQIAADGASNSPQTVSVVLNIAEAGEDIGAFVYPTGLIFVGSAGGTDPAAQTVSVTNPSTSMLTFTAGTTYGQTTPFFTVQPGSAPVDSTHPATLTVQPTIKGLAAGVYLGNIQLHFAPDNSSRNIAVLLIVISGSGSRTSESVTASSCIPKKLLPVFTQLGANFATVAAWPTPIEVTIVDDCGNLMTNGSVTASFSDSDPTLPLTSLNDGRWSATWQPRNPAAQVVITVDASELVPLLQGTQNIGGALQSNPTTPSVYAGGVVSAAKSAKNQPLAPGGFTSIYGVHLSAGQNPALSLPLATQLGATQVLLAGRPLPLQYAADGQVNAVIPYDIPPNSTQQLIVSNGPALSVPEPVVIAPAQPAIFAQADGFGVVFDVKPGKTVQTLVDATHPISAGDAIVIYCAGLGPVSPPVEAGHAAPSSPPAMTVNPVTVTIGGKKAQVFFGGLVGGFAGLYQVNAYVPTGIKAGADVPLVVTVMGFDSAPVSVAVK